MQILTSIKIREYFVAGYDTFFGYYDKFPDSGCGNLLLAGVTTGVDVGSSNQVSLTIGYFERGKTESFTPVATTSAWCWQQGAMLQWFPGRNSSQIVFNSVRGNGYGATVVDVRKKQVVEQYCRPLYAVCPNGRHALSCSFSRLHELRPGYGYPQIPDECRGDQAPSSDGVWLIDLGSNKAELYCSLSDVAKIAPLESMKGATHYINHLSFSPSGGRFLFLHLWVKNSKQNSRMIVGSITGEWHILTNSYVSHYCWKGDDEIIVYSEEQAGRRAYNLYDWTDGFVRPLFRRDDLPDGHPTISRDRTHLLTDTYPDRHGYQRLYLLDSVGRDRELGRFHHRSSLINEWRCDLHPRWNLTGQRVYIDSACKGRRRMIELDLAEALEKEMSD